MTRENPFAEHIGIEEVEVSPGTAEVKVQTKDYHTNILGYVHGGLIYSLADVAFELASNSHGVDAVGVTTSMQFHRAVKAGDTVMASATETHLGKTLATYHILVETNQQVVASFTGTVYRMSS